MPAFARLSRFVIALCWCCLQGLCAPNVTAQVRDDAHNVLQLTQPAKRIVSLSPHTTELLYEAGAGAALVAVTDYSDYPPAARQLPNIGNVFALDIERLLAYKPDLVVLWSTGQGHQLAERLRRLSLTVFESDPQHFNDIATSLERLSTLAGTTETGYPAAERFRTRLAELQTRYALRAGVQPIRVFYQISERPLMTLNDRHLVSEAIRLCGARNVFGARNEIAPTLSIEAVLAANPEAIFSTDSLAALNAFWMPYSTLQAVRMHRLFSLPGDLLNRATPRILEGTRLLCDRVHALRPSHP